MKEAFLEGMSFAATTVNVVTTDGPHGRAGLTVSAMASVSADSEKPTLLVCLNGKSEAAQKVLKNEVFCVNVLRDDQSYISDAFAGRYKEKLKDKFACGEWDAGATGALRARGALTAFDCRLHSSHQVGTHHICIGEVEEITVGRKGSALVYANRAYGRATPIEPGASPFPQDGDSRKTVAIGCFHTLGPYILPKLIKEIARTRKDISVSLLEGDDRRLKEALKSAEIDIALMYDFDADPDVDMKVLTRIEPFVLIHQSHELAAASAIATTDLDGEPMISVQENVGRDFLEGVLRRAGIEPNVVYRAHSLELARSLVGHGLGFSIAVTKPSSALTYDGVSVTARPLRGVRADAHLVIARARRGRQRDVVRAVSDIVFDLFSD